MKRSSRYPNRDVSHPTLPFNGIVRHDTFNRSQTPSDSGLRDASLAPFDPYWTIVPPLVATFHAIKPSQVIEQGTGWYSTSVLAALCKASTTQHTVSEIDRHYRSLCDYLEPHSKNRAIQTQLLYVFDNGPTEKDRIPFVEKIVRTVSNIPTTILLHDYQHPAYHTDSFVSLLRHFRSLSPNNSLFVYDKLHPTTLILTDSYDTEPFSRFATPFDPTE